jgi:hypothetical protein
LYREEITILVNYNEPLCKKLIAIPDVRETDAGGRTLQELGSRSDWIHHDQIIAFNRDRHNERFFLRHAVMLYTILDKQLQGQWGNMIFFCVLIGYRNFYFKLIFKSDFQQERVGFEERQLCFQ